MWPSQAGGWDCINMSTCGGERGSPRVVLSPGRRPQDVTGTCSLLLRDSVCWKEWCLLELHFSPQVGAVRL